MFLCRGNHVLEGATIKGKNILIFPIGSIYILAFKNRAYENR